MTASTLTVTDFVRARLAEDEAALACVNCGRAVEPDGDDFGHVAAALPEQDPRASEFWLNPCPAPEPPARVLAQCAAMRKIVERATWVLANPTEVSHADFCRAKADLFDLAEIYRDHPDHVWGDVIHITQQAVDAGLALLDAEGKHP